MIKLFSLAIILVACNSQQTKNNMSNPENAVQMQPSIHSLSYTDIQGAPVSLSSYRGKKILIVNTASECGFTPQYTQLQELYNLHKDQLVIIGFPANDFGQQEPGENKDILAFCEKNYGVTFPLSEKITVKGKGISPVFEWLTQKNLNGKMDAEVKWNFTKFLLDEDGHLLATFNSQVTPLDDAILNYLK